MIRLLAIASLLLFSFSVQAGKENELFIEIANESAELKVFEMLAEDVPIDELENYANKLTIIDRYLTQIVKKYPSSDLALKVATSQTIGFVNIQELRDFHDAIATRVERKQCLDQPDLNCFAGVLRHHAVNNRESIGSSPLAVLVGVYVSLEDVQTALQLAKLINPDTVKSWRLGKYISVLGDNVEFSFYEDIANHYSEGRKQQFYVALHKGLRKLNAKNSDRALSNMRSSDVISNPFDRDALIEELSSAEYFQEAFELLNLQREDDKKFYIQSAKTYLYYKLSHGLNNNDWSVAESLLEGGHQPFTPPLSVVLAERGTWASVILTKLNKVDTIKAISMMTRYHSVDPSDLPGVHYFGPFYDKLATFGDDIDANLAQEEIFSLLPKDHGDALLSGEWDGKEESYYDKAIKKFNTLTGNDERQFYSCVLSTYYHDLGDDNKADNYLNYCISGKALKQGVSQYWSVDRACKTLVAVSSVTRMSQFLRSVMLLSPEIDKDNSKIFYRVAHYCSGGTYYL